MLEKLSQFASDLNRKGVPIPTFRDPVTGKGSLSATMMIISHMAAIVLLLGKVTKVVGDVDYSNVLWLLGLTSSLYAGRKYQKNGKDMSIGESIGQPTAVEAPSEPSEGVDNAGTSK